jgi:hypothetical protein
VPLYIVESPFHTLEEPFIRSKGNVLGVGPGSEKLHLFVAELEGAVIAKLRPRVDEDGNKQNDRLALPGNEEWWIALEGEKAWPGIPRPKITSRCTYDASGVPSPRPVDEDELAALKKAGALK